ncbi:MAG TPA: c-type cytochrome [Polyangiaceae bacterium]|nr:c-type cytochrome [Polyangiaceae bacterium]
MSRTLLRSHTLLLCFSLFAATAASALFSAGCSSSDEPGGAAAGKGGGHSGGASSKGGGSSAEAGDTSDAGEPGEPSEPGDGQGGHSEMPGGDSGGTVASGGSATGGSPASGDAGDTGETGSAGSSDGVDEELAAAQARAVALINGLETTRKCTSCHDVTYQGSGFYPNITPDVETGIGSWDENEIKIAIRDGKDKDGKTLCATMERYQFSDAELGDIAVYLKHLTPIKKKITGKCPVP